MTEIRFLNSATQARLDAWKDWPSTDTDLGRVGRQAIEALLDEIITRDAQAGSAMDEALALLALLSEGQALLIATCDTLGLTTADDADRALLARCERLVSHHGYDDFGSEMVCALAGWPEDGPFTARKVTS